LFVMKVNSRLFSTVQVKDQGECGLESRDRGDDDDDEFITRMRPD
jgi:hypothetical protein